MKVEWKIINDRKASIEIKKKKKRDGERTLT